MSTSVAGPLVSIVTPTLGQGRFIEQTLRSVREQTYPHLEHIVVDGGSTDGTLEILRRHEGAYPMRWLSEPDAGMYDAVNKGMRLARGDILAYLNSDDLYFPWTLEVVVEAFERHPEADLICGDCVRREGTGDHRHPLFQPPPFRDYVMRTGFLAQPTVFWRRRLYDDIGDFDANLRFVADCDYWMRALDRGATVRKIDEFLAVDTIQEAALRSSHTAALLAEIRAVRARYVRLQGPGHVLRQARNRAWGALWRRLDWISLLTAYWRSRRGWSAQGGRWAHWVRAAGEDISTRHAILAQVPLLGRRHALQTLRPARGRHG